MLLGRTCGLTEDRRGGEYIDRQAERDGRIINRLYAMFGLSLSSEEQAAF